MLPNQPTFDDLAEKIISWVGSKSSLLVHTLLFAGCLTLGWLGFDINKILLVLTTVVSLEAIYLSIFIQYSVNRQAKKLQDVAQDIEEVTENVGEISADVDELKEGVDEISEDVDEISEDVEDISENLEDATTSGKPGAPLSRLAIIENKIKSLLKELNTLKLSAVEKKTHKAKGRRRK